MSHAAKVKKKPNFGRLGKYDPSEKIFWSIVIGVSLLVLVAVVFVLWRIEHPVL